LKRDENEALRKALSF